LKLYEYQAKRRFSQFRIPVPPGKTATSPDEVYDVAIGISSPIAIKSQVLKDNRAVDGIQFATDAEEARQKSTILFSSSIRGQLVEKVLVEAAYNIVTSLYLAIVYHHKANRPVMIAALSTADAPEVMDIQAIDQFANEIIHPFLGLHPYQARNLASTINLPYEHWSAFTEIAINLSQCYLASDALMAEISPLVVTSQTQLVALNCKMHIDDNALYRQPDIASLTQPGQIFLNPYSGQTRPVYLDGNIGCVANGSGLGMATMDAIQSYGGDRVQPGCMIDIGSEASESRLDFALQTIRTAPQLHVLVINIFAVVAPCDQTARILLRLLDKYPPLPTIIRLAGLNAGEGIQIIKNANLRHVVAFHTLSQASREAVDAAKNGSIWRS
jgi:succinyl-CoA synthetase beta subunit